MHCYYVSSSSGQKTTCNYEDSPNNWTRHPPLSNGYQNDK